MLQIGAMVFWLFL